MRTRARKTSRQQAPAKCETGKGRRALDVRFSIRFSLSMGKQATRLGRDETRRHRLVGPGRGGLWLAARFAQPLDCLRCCRGPCAALRARHALTNGLICC